jgi:hypothetical protein
MHQPANTKKGYDFFEAVSPFQKAIRMGDEQIALCFVEFYNSHYISISESGSGTFSLAYDSPSGPVFAGRSAYPLNQSCLLHSRRKNHQFIPNGIH